MLIFHEPEDLTAFPGYVVEIDNDNNTLGLCGIVFQEVQSG